MSFSFASISQAPMQLLGVVYIHSVWKPLPTLLLSHGKQSAPSGPISPKAKMMTGYDQGVNFQCIRNCLVQQASLTCKMGVLGRSLKLKETVSNRIQSRNKGGVGWGTKALALSIAYG